MTEGDVLVRILFVDDNPDRLRGLRSSLENQATVVLRTPEDVTAADLDSVDLISVDEYLGEEWDHLLNSETQTLSLRNEDGLSVAAAFRGQARHQKLSYAVSLHTGDLANLAAGIPQNLQEVLTAYQHDLDWVFDFSFEGLGPRLVQLAQAVKAATLHTHSLNRDYGATWLNVPTTSWTTTAREQIEDCRPPAHALANNTGGRSYLRWLAQRVLPFPTFLVNESHGANLLGLTVDSFRKLVTQAEANYEFTYQGPLDHFLGARYWRAALQQVLVDAGVDHWDSPKIKGPALSEFLGSSLEPLKSDQPVVTYDLNCRVLSIDAEANDAVRLQVDGWPVYADDPWARIEDVRENQDLSRLMALSDRQRIMERPDE